MSRYISTQRQNKAKKTPEVEEAREGKPHNRVKRAPPRPWGSPWPDRGCHHGPWCPPRPGHGGYCGGGPILFSVRLVLVSFGISPWAASFAFSWVFCASLQASFDPHSPHFISLDSSQTFLLKSRLKS